MMAANHVETTEESVKGFNRLPQNSSHLENCVIRCDSGRKLSVVKFSANALSQPPSPQIGKILGLTFRTSQSDTWLVTSLLAAHGFSEVPQTSNDFNLLWTGSHPRPHTFSSLKPYQRVNHFPRSYELTRKDRLCKNVARLQHIHGTRHFDFLPPSFVMPAEYRDLWSAHHRLHGPWIVKPVASSRGRGIYLISKPEEVPLEEPVLVSKYISNPLLVDGHKCDLRLYVAVTSYDPLVIYLYRHGIVRFAAVKYTADEASLDNPCIHLCNYSINKYHADFVVAEDPSVEDVGHKRSLSGFLKWLRTRGKDASLLMRRIEDLIIKSIMAATPPVAAACRMFVPHRSNCFELYGFDVLIDADLKPWLLEVNLSPSLGCDSSLDLRVKSSMLADLLTLVGIPAVDPTSCTSPSVSSPSSRQGRARTATSPAERSQYRRAQSADAQRSRIRSRTVKPTGSFPTLTAEESRVLSLLRDEYERRGDFNRIFPSTATWSQYGDFIDSLYTSSPALICPGANLNRMVHEQLFPEQNSETQTNATAKLAAKPPKKRISTRQTKSAHVRGHVMTSIQKNWRSLTEDSDVEDVKIHSPSTYEEAVLKYVTMDATNESIPLPQKSATNGHSASQYKEEIQNMFQNQHILSQEQARQGFSRYLRCVLQRLPYLESSFDADNQLDLIERFLQRLGAMSRTRAASPAKSPIKKMSSRDRVAVVASQLGEFIDRYERENGTPSQNQHHEDCERHPHNCKHVTTNVFDSFLRCASEKDIEEILFQHTRLSPCSHFLSGRCHPRSSTSPSNRNSQLGLLREMCYLPNSRPVRTRKDDADMGSSRNTVVTFDLTCTVRENRKLTSPLRSSKGGILKREKSM